MGNSINTFAEALEVFNDHLINGIKSGGSNKFNITPVTESEARDWGLNENMPDSEIKTLASDFYDEVYYLPACEAKDAWRYEN